MKVTATAVHGSGRHALAYQNLSAKQLAERLGVPRTWILDNAKTRRGQDSIPHVRMGKYKRFRWGSPDLAEWIELHVVSQYSVPCSEPRDVAGFEFLGSAELAARLNISESWVRDQVRTRATDPIPHVQFGKYVRFRWGSPELELWAERRMVTGNNRAVSRAQEKETVQ